MVFRTLFLAILALLMQPVSADSDDCTMNLDFSKRYLASDESVRLCDAYADTVLL
ncbi:MAG: glutathione peroxidase, partial [Proteobacteria bacterium]|nr:glutathione peroxidase [Pseudomonadota bacterium]